MGMLTGRTILVTGASAGIGRTAARLFAEEGATVILAARREAEGQAAAREAGPKACFIACDFADPAGIDRLFARIEAEHGGLDGAFNNAAMTQDAYTLPDTPPDLYDQVFDLNVRGLWLSLRHEMRIMRAAGRGAIVNTASIAGQRGFDGLSLYCGSKHAIIGITRAAALDGAAFGVRVNSISPGTTRTEMMMQQMLTRPGGEADTVKAIPLKRTAEPVEQARAAAWLLSDLSSFVTGENLTVDGGRTIR